MNVRKSIKLGFNGLLLAAAGAFIGVGIFAVVFAWFAGSYAPSTSSDLAAWIQAIGSIGAIAAAYFLGERQARRAREQALEIFRLQRTRVEDGSRGVVSQLYGEILAISQAAHRFDYRTFSEFWQTYLKGTCAAALDAFDHLPLHELGSNRRVQVGFEMRGIVVHTTARITQMLEAEIKVDDATSASDRVNRQRFEEGRRIIEIRKAAEISLEGQTKLRDSFYSTYQQ
ncbi:hypothetical protein [Achromobacter sp. DH1f]|uniref:hypothetical protein n=1 Tax=Achromobacter sp. DH1f TaxID=1397275 RepID=UPI0004693EC4|nr:hypothetical protein [Achromobacter sp. DH1f]